MKKMGLFERKATVLAGLSRSAFRRPLEGEAAADVMPVSEPGCVPMRRLTRGGAIGGPTMTPGLGGGRSTTRRSNASGKKKGSVFR